MRPRLSSVVVIAAVAVAGFLAAGAALRSWLLRNETLLERAPNRNHPDFDLSFALPGSPQGIATDGQELLAGNRSDPWGALRLTRHGDTFSAQKVEILERRFQQKINLFTITWNGTHYAGLTSAAWFRRGAEGEVFTVHDPKTLAVISTHDAPKLIGCLAWDGMHYWAATRRHTADSPEPALLYRFDRTFNVLSTHAAPGVGCQGMAWDGRHLWIADVFDDSVRVLDVSREPRVIHRAFLNIEYLSGIVAFEGEIWVTEYGHQQLHRIRRSSRLAWLRGDAQPVIAASAIAPASEAVLFGSQKNEFAKRPANDVELLEWSATLRDGHVVADWRLWFGPELQSARYEVSVILPDGSAVRKEWPASPGENAMSDVSLTPATAPGDYRVEVLLQTPLIQHWGGRLDLRK